ncbi:hypothetical protein D3C77_97870 [compost metagenome]
MITLPLANLCNALSNNGHCAETAGVASSSATRTLFNLAAHALIPGFESGVTALYDKVNSRQRINAFVENAGDFYAAIALAVRQGSHTAVAHLDEGVAIRFTEHKGNVEVAIGQDLHTRRGHVIEHRPIVDADFQRLLKRLETDVEGNPGFYADASIHLQIQTHRNTQNALHSTIPNKLRLAVEYKENFVQASKRRVDMASALASTESSPGQPATASKPSAKNVKFPEDERSLQHSLEIDPEYPCPGQPKLYPTQAAHSIKC